MQFNALKPSTHVGVQGRSVRAGGGAKHAPGSSRPRDAVLWRKIDEIVIGAAVRSRLRRCSRPQLLSQGFQPLQKITL